MNKQLYLQVHLFVLCLKNHFLSQIIIGLDLESKDQCAGHFQVDC